MPKLKTRKAAAKRFTKLSGGKIKRRQANAGHIMTKKQRSGNVNCVKGHTLKMWMCHVC